MIFKPRLFQNGYVSSHETFLNSGQVGAKQNNKPVEVPLWVKFIELSKGFADDTTCHGFLRIKDNPSWINKSMWIVLVVVACIYSLYSFINFLILYFEYQVAVNYQMVTDVPTEFPAVTICNLNPFDVTTQSWVGDELVSYLTKNGISSTVSLTSNEQARVRVGQIASVLQASVTANTTLNSTLLQSFGFTLETMLVSCSFNGNTCSYSDFTWWRNNEFGNCYTFNAYLDNDGNVQSAQTVSQPGLKSGLTLELYIGAAGKNDYYTIDGGVKVAINDRGILPLIKYEGMYVSPGTFTSISIAKTVNTKLDAPFSNCRKNIDTVSDSDSIYFKKTSSISKYYKNLCDEICINYEFVIKICGCSDPSVPITDYSLNICNNISSLDCIDNVSNSYEDLNVQSTCDEYCPLECDTTLYSKSSSSAAYPSQYYANVVSGQSNLQSKFTKSDAGSFAPPPPPSGRKRRAGPPGPPPAATTQTSTSTTTRTSTTTTRTSTSTTTTTGGPAGPPPTSPSSLTTTTSQVTTTTTTRPPTPASTSSTRQTSTTTTRNRSSGGSGGGGSGSSPPSGSQIKQSVLTLSVYFESLSYTSIEEQPLTTVDTLIGLIGAQFGLYIGASFLSFVEFSEFFTSVCLAILGDLYVRYKKRKSPKKQASPGLVQPDPSKVVTPVD